MVFRKLAEPNEQIQGKVPIGIVARMDAYMEREGIRFRGDVMAKALDAYLKDRGA